MKKQNSRKAPYIPFSRPSVGREEERGVLSVMRSGWLTTGKATLRFEEEFARYVGAPYALALNSATAGLHLALEALGVCAGTVVVTVPYTFVATAEVVRYLGAELVFVDIDTRTLNMDPAKLDAMLGECGRQGKKVSAIIPVHVAGLPCDMQAICGIAERYGVPVIEDAAHAFPVKVGGKYAGTFGAAGVYSFYATKTITTGEGGMVVTADEAVAKRIRVMRLHGIDRDIWNRYTSPSASWRYDVVAPGFKYNLTDIAAAIGLAQLAKAEAFLNTRRRIARRYLEGLGDCGFLALPADQPNHGWHLFIVRIRPERLGIDRDRFIEELSSEGIGASVHFIPLHLMSYYRDRYAFKPSDFPVSLAAFESCISLPLFPSLKDSEVDRVIETVRGIGERFTRRPA
jgi:dTDP-4-amino-4,6-dideoxygalactose transaminase